ncbi:MAG: hypothetical protein ACK5Q1_19585, partial [Limnobacter sp.]
MNLFFLLMALVLQPRLALAQALDAEETEKPQLTFKVQEEFKSLIELATNPIRNTAQVNDTGDAWQLYRRLRPAIRDALGTQGYFSPIIGREVDENLPEDAA